LFTDDYLICPSLGWFEPGYATSNLKKFRFRNRYVNGYFLDNASLSASTLTGAIRAASGIERPCCHLENSGPSTVSIPVGWLIRAEPSLRGAPTIVVIGFKLVFWRNHAAVGADAFFAAAVPRSTWVVSTNRKYPSASANSTDCLASAVVTCGFSASAWRGRLAPRRTS
jgi:hypothetical protein